MLLRIIAFRSRFLQSENRVAPQHPCGHAEADQCHKMYEAQRLPQPFHTGNYGERDRHHRNNECGYD